MKKKLLTWIIGVVIVVLIAFGLTIGQKSHSSKEPEVIKIGAILPLTGNLAFMGEYEKKGMLIAEEYINNFKIISKKIKIVFGDSKGNPQEGVNEANKMINIEKIKFLITSTTGVSRSVMGLLKDKNFLLLAFCMDPSIHKENRYIVRLYYGMEQEANIILHYFEQIKNKERDKLKYGIGILHVQHAGAEQQVRDYLLPGLGKLGIKVNYVETYQFNQKDFKVAVTKLKEKKIKYLVIIGYGFVYPQIFNALEEYNLLHNITIIGGWGFIAQRNIPPVQLKDVIVAVPEYIFEKNEIAQKFEELYYKKFNQYPNFDAALAFENIYLLAKAIEEKGEEIDKIALFLKDKKIKGVLGECYLDKDGGLFIPMCLAKFDDKGNLIKIEEGK